MRFNLRRRKYFHEKGLARRDHIRPFGKDLTRRCRDVADKEGCRERPRPPGLNQHDIVAHLRTHSTQAYLQLAKSLPKKDGLAACSSPNEWVFLSDLIVGVDTACIPLVLEKLIT